MLPAINAVLRVLFHEKKCMTPLDFQKVKRVLVIDYALLGDSVMSTSFLRIIKKNIPNVHLTLACSRLEKEVLEEQGIADEFITIQMERLAKAVKNYRYIKKAARKINRQQYDIAIEPRGDIRFIYLMHLCNAERKISYTYTGGECFLTDAITPSDTVTHLVEDKLYLLKKIGMRFEKKDMFPKLCQTEEGKAYARNFISEHGINETFIIGIHPGASLALRNWKHYPELLRLLGRKLTDVSFLVFEGPGEQEIVSQVMEAAEKTGAKAIRVKKGIKEYIHLAGFCDIMVCNDSGAGHLAAALGVKVYVIFGPGLPKEVRPYSDSGVYCFSNHELSCKPCRARTCRHNGACLESVKTEDVFRKIIATMKNDRMEGNINGEDSA
ncbi:MAG: glycosyltransferase family 9 protein [Eubacterium sp.]|nr:glycosyltransferase family 9 protein [Eubacterium sp.]